MPEMQKPVLEHAAPKANQNQGLDSHLADEATALMQKADEFSPSPEERPEPVFSSPRYAEMYRALKAAHARLVEAVQRHDERLERCSAQHPLKKRPPTQRCGHRGN